MYSILRRCTPRHVPGHSCFPFERVSAGFILQFHIFRRITEREKGREQHSEQDHHYIHGKGNTKVARAALCINRFHQFICFRQTKQSPLITFSFTSTSVYFGFSKLFRSTGGQVPYFFSEREFLSAVLFFCFWVIASEAGH